MQDHMSMHANTYTHKHTHTHAHTHAGTHMHVCTHARKYVYMYARRHAHTPWPAMSYKACISTGKEVCAAAVLPCAEYPVYDHSELRRTRKSIYIYIRTYSAWTKPTH